TSAIGADARKRSLTKGRAVRILFGTGHGLRSESICGDTPRSAGWQVMQHGFSRPCGLRRGHPRAPPAKTPPPPPQPPPAPYASPPGRLPPARGRHTHYPGVPMPRKRKRKPPGPPVMICVDKLTFKRFLAAVCDLSAALQDAHSTVTMLHELLVTKRRQSDAA